MHSKHNELENTQFIAYLQRGINREEKKKLDLII